MRYETQVRSTYIFIFDSSFFSLYSSFCKFIKLDRNRYNETNSRRGFVETRQGFGLPCGIFFKFLFCFAFNQTI